VINMMNLRKIRASVTSVGVRAKGWWDPGRRGYAGHDRTLRQARASSRYQQPFRHIVHEQ
jgi:hypothetical protein